MMDAVRQYNHQRHNDVRVNALAQIRRQIQLTSQNYSKRYRENITLIIFIKLLA